MKYMLIAASGVLALVTIAAAAAAGATIFDGDLLIGTDSPGSGVVYGGTEYPKIVFRTGDTDGRLYVEDIGDTISNSSSTHSIYVARSDGRLMLSKNAWWNPNKGTWQTLQPGVGVLTEYGGEGWTVNLARGRWQPIATAGTRMLRIQSGQIPGTRTGDVAIAYRLLVGAGDDINDSPDAALDVRGDMKVEGLKAPAGETCLVMVDDQGRLFPDCDE